MTALKTSIVVIARNEPPEQLHATLAGLFTTTAHHDREILVIDDGSDPPIANLSAEVTLVRNPEPVGVSRSRRLGAALTAGDVLVWLDAHMSFAPDWLDQMLEHVGPGAILCSAFWRYDLSGCHCWGADFAWRGGRDQGPQRYPGFTVKHRARFPGAGAVEVPLVIGGCYMMLRETYQRLGGFSPLSRVQGGNEQDFCARARIGGLDVRCVTGARVGHLWRRRFPYPVEFAHHEFNQLVLVHTVFEESTVSALDRCFQPYSPSIRRWLEEETGLEDWRRSVQSNRKFSDTEFFARFVPGIESYLKA